MSGGRPESAAPHAPGRIADALVLTFTAGVGLADWESSGILEREWALYAHMGPLYGHVVLVTWGGRGDASEHNLLSRLRFAPGVAPPRLTLISCDAAEAEGDGAAVAARVHEMLLGTPSTIVKTNQMQGGHIASAIAARLRAGGMHGALVARGGYPWSRFSAWRHGAASREARAAAQREGALCREADLIIATTPEMAGDLAWRYEIAEDRFAVIPNYIDAASLPGAPVAGAASAQHATILFAGRLERQKRLDRLLEAVTLLPRDLRDRVHLSIIGEGSHEARLRAQAGALGLNVTFEPRMPHAQLLGRMRTCDVYAQTSDYEGHPKTVLEAMAAGAPVLVCDTPGLGAVVQDGLTGLRVPARPEAIAAGLRRLLTDAALARALGATASAHAREYFALPRIVQLEIAAHRRALQFASQRVAPTTTGGPVTTHAGPGPVQFDASLLEQPVSAAVAAWIRPLRGFARRLEPRTRAQFLMALDTPLYHLQGESAVEADGGLHPKHRLMRYHDFFTERITPGQRAIDLGCGVGALAASIAKRSRAFVTGMDWSEANLARARARATEQGLAGILTYIQGDITENRAEGEFKVVVLSNVLEHLTERPQRLRTWRKWYGDPRFLIRVPAFDREWRTPWKEELGVEWRLDPTHETEYTQAQLEQECREAGLRITECIVRWGEYYIVADPA